MTHRSLILSAISLIFLACAPEETSFKLDGDYTQLKLDLSRDPGGGAGAPENAPEGGGQVLDNLNGIEIHISSIEVHRAGAGWQPYMSDVQISHLLAGDGDISILFAEKELPAGHYTMIRLILAETGNKVIHPQGDDPIEIPSSIKTGIKIPCNFDFSGGFLQIALDLNLDKSIRENAQGFFMDPVIKCSTTGNQATNNTGGNEEPPAPETCYDPSALSVDWCENGRAIIDTQESEENVCIEALTCVYGDDIADGSECSASNYEEVSASCSGMVASYPVYQEGADCFTFFICLEDEDDDGQLDQPPL